MEKETDIIENVRAEVPRFTTKLKFIKSARNSALISFVSQNTATGVLCGVRQDSLYPKKIVIIDRALAHKIIVNVLYDCVLIPMGKVFNKNTGELYVPGYIAIDATPVQFKATVATNYLKGVEYSVEVSFGNKVVRYDPFKGKKESVKSLAACKAVLEKRCDVRDLEEVLQDFEYAAMSIEELLREDMRYINSRPRYGYTGQRYRN